MIISHLLLAIGWILFCLLHSVFASLLFKQKLQLAMGGQYKYYRIYYTIIALLSFAAVMAWLIFLPSERIFKTNTATVLTGCVVGGLGFIIVITCIIKYFMQLSGLRGLIENRTGGELMITGIHKFVRHPLYLGTFIFIWGLWLLIPTWALLIVNIIITTYTTIGIRFEEQKLVKEFGEKYTAYQNEVPMFGIRLK